MFERSSFFKNANYWKGRWVSWLNGDPSSIRQLARAILSISGQFIERWCKALKAQIWLLEISICVRSPPDILVIILSKWWSFKSQFTSISSPKEWVNKPKPNMMSNESCRSLWLRFKQSSSLEVLLNSFILAIWPSLQLKAANSFKQNIFEFYLVRYQSPFI